MAAHAVHTLPPAMRARMKKIRDLLEKAKAKYPDGIPDAVRKAIFKDPAAVELAQAAVALEQTRENVATDLSERSQIVERDGRRYAITQLDLDG